MKTSITDSILTLFLEGRIDTNNAAQTEQEIFSAVEGKTENIVLDAEKLEYISSAGLRVLMKLRKSINKPLPIINVSRDVYEILDTTGFTELLDVKKALRQVSVEGCELIGSGGYGKVYRIDPETIVKVYNPGISLEFVEQERRTSQKAFLMGVPTAISYDVVKCGDCYGVVYWSLMNYRTNLPARSEASEEWDELEKSIIAKLADDVKVWLKGSSTEVVIEKLISIHKHRISLCGA